MATVNRKDRHVAATALAHGADLVVSNDRRLRRTKAAVAVERGRPEVERHDLKSPRAGVPLGGRWSACKGF